MLNAFYSIFSPNYSGVELYEAVASGNLDKVSEITNSIFRPNFSSIRKDTFEHDILIVCGNNTEIANILLDNYSDEISPNAKGWGFKRAALKGHHQIVELLLKRCSVEISADDKDVALRDAARNSHHKVVERLLNRCSVEISANYKGWALRLAVENGHHQVVELLLNRCNAEISANDKVSAFRNATKNGHHQVVELLLNRGNAEISANDKVSAFRNAAKNGHHQVVELLLNRCNAEISANDKVSTFKNAADNGHHQVVELLLNRCNAEISADDKGSALERAALNGHDQIVTLLIKRCSKEISADDKESALGLATENGHHQVVELLLNRCNAEISADDKVSAFRNAVHDGHHQIVELLLKRCSVEISADDKEVALRDAAQNNHHQLVELLLNRCSVWIRASHKGYALEDAAKNGHLAALNALLADENVLALAAGNNNRSLRDAQMRANGGPEDAARYQPIVDRLMLIPAVAQLAAQQQAAQPQHGQQGMALAEMTQFSENSMMALSEGEKDLLNNLIKHYKAFYDTIGDWSIIKSEIVNYLEEAYKKHPALNEKGEALPLGFTANLSEASNKAYYQHSIHTAWRYFSRPNPWMSPNAQNVERFDNGSGAAIISDSDKEIISYLWIALNDESVTLESNFSVEGNKNLFIETIASLARSHNRDARPINPANYQAWRDGHPNIALTTADDMAADKPSCSWGVKKALFQAVYGHPYINCPEAQALSPEIMLARMIERLVKRNGQKDSQANIEDKLDGLSIEQLEEIKNKLTDLFATLDPNGKEEEIKMPELQISKAQLDAFIENAKLWFSAQRIEAQKILMPNNMGNDEYSTHPCNNYIELIRHYASNPEQAFAMHLMNEYLNQRIEVLRQESVSPHAILHSFSLLSIRNQDTQLEYNELEITNKLHRKSRLS